MKEIFARNLRQCRQAAGLSQVKLAERIHYTGKAVSKWESGTTLPPAEVLPKLAAALNTDLNTLFDYREEPSYFLGIDGGGTKTRFVLADAAGTVLQDLILPACNPTSVGMEQAVAVLEQGIRAVCREVPFRKISVFAGIAGGSVGSNRAQLLAALEHFRFSGLAIGSDAETIIAAGLRGREGVVAILGTGSVVFAVSGKERHQIGGYGHLIGDAFSGSELGRLCLGAALNHADGSGRPTAITEKVQKALGGAPLSALPVLYEKGKSYLATFAPLLFEAAAEGDELAAELLNGSLRQFTRQLKAAERRCPAGAPMVLAGGITRFSKQFLPQLQEQLHHIELLEQEPVFGALLLAGGTIK